jgi:multidrug efflux pump subunit AcrB
VVAIVIPVTILLTLFAALVMGYTLNRVSLFALIFSIGILVDDAIVVIENIARHWGMGGGRDRKQAAIEAVAEVGNPTIVATLTVVAALLPMLFVSGMMGPYMSPIPANASAAMIFSFFVAVMVTPWLMLKIAGRRADASWPAAKATTVAAGSGRMYRAVARPILATKTSSWIFLLVVGGAVARLARAVLHQGRDGEALPFDNKSELSVVIDMPEGTSVEATDAVAQAVAREVLKLPEVKSVQTHAGTAAPFNFNGLVRHSFCARPTDGRCAAQPDAKTERDRVQPRDRARHPRADQGSTLPEGASLKVVEPPPGPPVMATLLAEIYGPDAETRRAVAARVEEAFRSADFIVDIDKFLGSSRAERARVKISPMTWNSSRSRNSDVFDTIGILNTGQTVGYSHRGGGRTPIAIRLERAPGDRLLTSAFLTTPIPANVLPGDRRSSNSAMWSTSEERASFPVFRHNGRDAEMVMAELAGDLRSAALRHDRRPGSARRMDWTGLEKPVIALNGQPTDEQVSTLLWDGEWEVTWVTFRDMGAAFGVALLGIYILVVAQFGSFKRRWSS